MGKIPSSGRLRLTLKQVEWFVLWWQEVFLSTYFFPPNISRSVAAKIGSPLESDLFMYFRQLQKGPTDLFEGFPGNT